MGRGEGGGRAWSPNKLWLNMEVGIQSLFGSMSRDVHSCTHWLRPRNPPPPHWDSQTWALLVTKDRRNLFVTHCISRQQNLSLSQSSMCGRPNSLLTWLGGGGGGGGGGAWSPIIRPQESLGLYKSFYVTVEAITYFTKQS